MRRILSCITLCLLGALFFSNPASAIDTAFWFNREIDHSVVTYGEGEESYRGQCEESGVNIWSYEDNAPRSSSACETYTQWGKISEAGVVIWDLWGEDDAYFKLKLKANQQILRSPDSRRIYIAEKTSGNMFKIGYIDKVTQDIFFNITTKQFETKRNWVYLPTQYSNIGFSNNSYFVVGVSGTKLVRTSLRDFSTMTFSGTDAEFPVSSLTLMAIDRDGTFVTAANQNNSVVAYDLLNCQGSDCYTRKLIDNQTLITNQASLYVTDYGDEVHLFSGIKDGQISRVEMSVDYSPMPDRYVTYTALGDSYSSGEGGWDYYSGTDGSEEFPNEKCHQSRNSYPSIYYGAHYTMTDFAPRPPAAKGKMLIGYGSFRNVTCSGAATNDILPLKDADLSIDEARRENYPGQFRQGESFEKQEDWRNLRENASGYWPTPGRTTQIEFIERYKPTIATIGVGGNDIGFKNVIAACITSQFTCSQASSMKWIQGSKIRNEFYRLDKLFFELHKASPETRFYAVGYPVIIADDDWQCGANVLLDAYEREFIKQSTRYLNQVIKAAAKRNGMTYINFEDVIGNHGLCGSSRGVNGLLVGEDPIFTIGGVPVRAIANESYHPTAFGQLMMGGRLVEWYGNLDTYVNSSCPSIENGYCPDPSISAPWIPEYFGSGVDMEVVQKEFFASIVNPSLPLSLAQFMPNAIIQVTGYSEPTKLGSYKADGSGAININVPLPSYLEPGYHTIYVSGTGQDGKPLVYEQVILYLPEDTKLGPCSFLPYSNLDQDNDGIDDACDPEIEADDQILVDDPSSILTYPNPPRPRPAATNPPTSSPIDTPAQTSPIFNFADSNTSPFDEKESPLVNLITPAQKDSNHDQSQKPNSYTLVFALIGGGIVVIIAGYIFWRRFRV